MVAFKVTEPDNSSTIYFADFIDAEAFEAGARSKLTIERIWINDPALGSPGTPLCRICGCGAPATGLFTCDLHKN